MRERTRLRSDLPSSKSLEKSRELTAEINVKVIECSSSLWKNILESIDQRTTPLSYGRWSAASTTGTLSFLLGTRPSLDSLPQALPSFYPQRQQADLLESHYASISRLPHNCEDPHIKRKFYELRVDLQLHPQFTPEMVTGSIKQAG